MHDRPRETFQSANLQIRAFARQLDPDGAEPWEFFCECGCLGLVELTAAEFDAAEPGGVWLPGHEPSG